MTFSGNFRLVDSRSLRSGYSEKYQMKSWLLISKFKVTLHIGTTYNTPIQSTLQKKIDEGGGIKKKCQCSGCNIYIY